MCILKVNIACIESYIVSSSFNEFRIFFNYMIFRSIMTFIYLFFYYLYFNLFI